MSKTIENSNLTSVRKTIVGVQFLFVAFGATVLVPLLVGLDPATALFTAGIKNKYDVPLCYDDG